MNSVDKKENEGLTLDDLKVGQVFRSGTHQLDEAQIVAFAKNLILNLFIPIPLLRKILFSRVWLLAVGIQPRFQ